MATKLKADRARGTFLGPASCSFEAMLAPRARTWPQVTADLPNRCATFSTAKQLLRLTGDEQC